MLLKIVPAICAKIAITRVRSDECGAKAPLMLAFTETGD